MLGDFVMGDRMKAVKQRVANELLAAGVLDTMLPPNRIRLMQKEQDRLDSESLRMCDSHFNEDGNEEVCFQVVVILQQPSRSVGFAFDSLEPVLETSANANLPQQFQYPYSTNTPIPKQQQQSKTPTSDQSHQSNQGYSPYNYGRSPYDGAPSSVGRTPRMRPLSSATGGTGTDDSSYSFNRSNRQSNNNESEYSQNMSALVASPTPVKAAAGRIQAQSEAEEGSLFHDSLAHVLLPPLEGECARANPFGGSEEQAEMAR
jgi:hypothetical protein